MEHQSALPIIFEKEFWNNEIHSPLLGRNNEFLTSDSCHELRTRALLWLDLARDQKQRKISHLSQNDNQNENDSQVETTPPVAHESPQDGHIEIPDGQSALDKKLAIESEIVASVDPEMKRIFVLDAERTFKCDKYRTRLVNLLYRVYENVVGDYHQGLGFVVSFLILFLRDEEVLELVGIMNNYYVPGYFKATAVAYIRDSKVFEQALLIYDPSMGNKITTYAPAESYCSKWFIGLNIHVLTYEALFDFFDNFLAFGFSYLYQFGLSLIETCRTDIEKSTNTSQILSILRLDKAVYKDASKIPNDETGEAENLFVRIVLHARNVDTGNIDFEKLKADVLVEMERAEERRKQRDAELDAMSDDEIVFSDEEGSDDNGDKDE